MKWMVSSTANPMAMLPIIIVNMSIVIPTQPMIPSVMMMGVRFGTMLMSPPRRFPIKRIISGVMIASARP